MGNESYVSSVYRIEAYEGTRMGKGFDDLKGKFNSLKLTEAVDDKNRDEIGEKVGKFFESFSKGYKSVEHMEEIAGDSNKTETQKQFAMNDLDLLGKVVYDSIRDDNKYKRLVGQGSASEIDENLPKEFKGIGKIVLKNVFEEGPVLETLRELDKSRMGLIEMPEGREKKKLKNQIVRKAMEKLVGLNNLTPGQIVDRARSLGYLELEVEGGKTEKVKSERRKEAGEEARKPETSDGGGKKRIIEPPINLLSGKDDEQTGDQLGTFRALSELEGPINNSHEEISKWAFRVTDSMARGSLFFAGSWQQIGPYIERQIESMFAGDKSVGAEKRKAEEREYVQALLTCRIQEQAILHCDGDPSKYASFLPPPDVMNDYMWNKNAVSLVEGKIGDKEIGIVGEIRRYLRQKAYTPKGGVEIANGLGSGGAINIYAQELVQKIKEGNMSFKNQKNEDITVNLGSNFARCEIEAARTALALFIVEDYAQWSLWSCKTSVEEKGLDKVPWMKVDPDKKKVEEAPHESSVWTKRVMDKTGRTDWVQTWGADFPGAIGNTCVQHPYCQFMRPVDLYRLKSSWNEEILQPLEESLCDLALRKWAYKDNGEKIDGGARNMLSPSKVKPKDFNRWNAMVSTWVGGSQADALDNFKDWLKGAEQLKALLQLQSNVLDLGGEVAGDVFYHKTRAFMSMQKSDFLRALSTALGGDIYEVKEIQAFKGDLLGSTGIGEFGQLFESIRRINLHMGTKRFNQAMAMLQTGVNDPERAEKLLKVKKAAIVGQGIMNTLGGMAGQKKR